MAKKKKIKIKLKLKKISNYWSILALECLHAFLSAFEFNYKMIYKFLPIELLMQACVYSHRLENEDLYPKKFHLIQPEVSKWIYAH